MNKQLLVKNISAVKTFEKNEIGRRMEIELRPGTSLHFIPRLNEKAEFFCGNKKIAGTVETFLSKTVLIVDTFNL